MEPTAKDLRNRIDLDDPPFIHLRYVMIEAHLLSGLKVNYQNS